MAQVPTKNGLKHVFLQPTLRSLQPKNAQANEISATLYVQRLVCTEFSNTIVFDCGHTHTHLHTHPATPQVQGLHNEMQLLLSRSQSNPTTRKPHAQLLCFDLAALIARLSR